MLHPAAEVVLTWQSMKQCNALTCVYVCVKECVQCVCMRRGGGEGVSGRSGEEFSLVAGILFIIKLH